MKYYKYADDFIFDEGITYVEVDDGCAFRQINVGSLECLDSNVYYQHNCVASNINYAHGGLRLAEGYVDYDAFVEVTDMKVTDMKVTPITQQEFEAVWNAHLARYDKQWRMAKARYPIGTPVVGTVCVFYSQGVIVDLGLNALGVADSVQSRASAKPEWMYPGHQLTATVSGYDEENQWVKLEAPQVHSLRQNKSDKISGE